VAVGGDLGAPAGALTPRAVGLRRRERALGLLGGLPRLDLADERQLVVRRLLAHLGVLLGRLGVLAVGHVVAGGLPGQRVHAARTADRRRELGDLRVEGV